MEEFGGVVLLSFAVEGERRINRVGENLAGQAKRVRHGGRQVQEQPAIEFPDRQQL
jgi:hypothetical protein